MSSPLNQKIAIVTGASSGLGKAVADQLAHEEATVIALARNIQPVAFAPSVSKISVDITKSEDLKAVFNLIDKQTATIDILVNCAGRGLVKNLEQTTSEEIAKILDLNLKANIMVAQEVYARMIPHKTGHIVNIVSTSGVKARADESIYCASKWGLRGFTESLRMAAVAHNIRVTGVYPGGMDTNFWKGGEPRDTSTYMKAEDIAAQVIHLLKSPTSIAPSEYIIERGF